MAPMGPRIHLKRFIPTLDVWVLNPNPNGVWVMGRRISFRHVVPLAAGLGLTHRHRRQGPEKV